MSIMPKPFTKPLKGFSLLELLMALAISTVLTLIVVPGLSWYQSSQLEHAAHQLIHAHQQGRLFAIQQQCAVYITPRNNHDWSELTWHTAEGQLVAHFSAPQVSVHFKGFIYAPHLVIDSHGQSDNAGQWHLKKRSLTKTLILNRGGRLRFDDGFNTNT